MLRFNNGSSNRIHLSGCAILISDDEYFHDLVHWLLRLYIGYNLIFGMSSWPVERRTNWWRSTWNVVQWCWVWSRHGEKGSMEKGNNSSCKRNGCCWKTPHRGNESRDKFKDFQSIQEEWKLRNCISGFLFCWAKVNETKTVWENEKLWFWAKTG